MAFYVQRESSRQAEVEALLRQSDQIAARLYPGEFRRPLNVEALDAPHISVLVARNEDLVAVGCCSLFDSGDGTIELKRMIVDQSFRERGVGAALLSAAETTARANGIHLIRMEVGIRNTDGQALHRKAGYKESAPFGSYAPSPISLLFEKDIGT
ncbi:MULTISPECIES: GNAT family N-acetyltransferase [Rhizobium]|uniref:Putative acetyltransferase n=1 Tax=Rhizobium miluonense TaxID=411945 RepID=A0A1C3X6R5_9HYPH|nr:GNAT family N-acetyltransferase [Rhizobium miluonense]SCB47938.1 putative acetyltransferase [Rhizobium miluonense]